MARNKSKVIRYRKPLNFNIGIVIFLVFFLYLVYNVGSYMLKDRKQIYEVGQVDTVVKDNTYDGLILRSEEVNHTTNAGYINLYVRENSRASAGETVYSIDETGSYTQMLNSNSTGTSTLTTDQLNSLKKKLAAFSASYESSSFSSVYDTKYSVENLLMSYLSADSMEQLAEMGIDTKYLTTVNAEHSGIVEYMEDGMEDLKEEDLTGAHFNRANYTVNNIIAGSMLEKGAFAYKTITSELWYVYLPLTEEDQNDLRELDKVYLHFNDVNLDIAADFQLITTSDNMVLGRCKLSRYMIQLADRRFTSVTVKKSAMASLTRSGLKIPKTSVVEKEFFVIPEGYATRGSNSDAIGFIRASYTATGTQASLIYPTIYAQNEGFYYVDADSIEGGTVLIVPDNPVIQDKTDEEKALESTTVNPENAAGTPGSDAATQASSSSAEAAEESSSEESTEETTEEDIPEETVAYNPDMEMDGAYIPVEVEETAEASTEGDNRTVSTLDPETGIEYVQTPVSKTTYTIGEKRPLRGAYSVNKGYAIFKQINIIDETDDYFIISNNLSYGLAIYDHILLNGSAANEGDIIY